MSNSIVLAKDLDVTKIKYDEPKVLDNGAKMVYVSFKNSPLRIQTPMCHVPFGLSVYKNNNTESHSMDFSLDMKDAKGDVKDFMTKLEAIDKNNVQKGFENQQQWFKKKFTNSDFIEVLYTSMIKYSKLENGEVNTQWPPRFKFKLPYAKGAYQFEMYDKNHKLIDPSTVETKNGRAIAILKCNGIWISGGKFSMTWKAEQVQVFPIQQISGYCIQYVKDELIHQEGDDEEDIIKKPKKTTQKIKEIVKEETDDEEEIEATEETQEIAKDDEESKEETSIPTTNEVSDSDEEEPVVAPTLKFKKKVVKKKSSS